MIISKYLIENPHSLTQIKWLGKIYNVIKYINFKRAQFHMQCSADKGQQKIKGYK